MSEITLLNRLRPVFFVMMGLSLILISCKEEKKTDPTMAGSETDTREMESTAAEPPIQVNPISHASTVLEWDGVTLYIDPVGDAGQYADYPAPDVILITDIHGDHLSQETLAALPADSARLIVPQAVANQLRNPLKERAETLDNGSSLEVRGISVTAIPMYNLREEALDFHTKGRGNGYVLEKNGTRVYFSGDTEDIPEMRALEDIDMAFICMNLPYTMTVDSAADAVLEFQPDAVYPYHYRGNPDVSDTERFRRLIEEGNPEIEVVQLDWYPGEPY